MRRSRQEGLSMVESALLLSLVGIILAVMLPAFFERVRTSKVAEATQELAAIHQAASSYYQTPQTTPAGKRLRCLPEAAGPTPPLPSVEPVDVAFTGPTTPGAATWHALGYQPESAIRYRYSFLPSQAGCGLRKPGPDETPLLRLRAEGDLDGDGYLSFFERSADDHHGELSPRPMLQVQDRVE